MAKCAEKKQYKNRMAAETALGIAQAQWRRKPSRAEKPPVRVYVCPACKAWHLTHTALSG
jgi:hypothetical protein